MIKEEETKVIAISAITEHQFRAASPTHLDQLFDRFCKSLDDFNSVSSGETCGCNKAAITLYEVARFLSSIESS